MSGQIWEATGGLLLWARSLRLWRLYEGTEDMYGPAARPEEPAAAARFRYLAAEGYWYGMRRPCGVRYHRMDQAKMRARRSLGLPADQ